MQIRPVREEDAKELLQIFRYYVENTAVTFEIKAPSVREFQKKIREISGFYPYLVAEQEGKILGYAYASPLRSQEAYRRVCETTIYLDPECRRQGIGQKLYDLLTELLRRMNMANLYACVAVPTGKDPYLDHSSELFHRAVGFRKGTCLHSCGWKFGRWYSVRFMEKMIAPHRRKLPDLRAWSPNWVSEIQK